MSSLIEWPSLYGSSYFIPAVVVVVLLLALLLLMSSRRRATVEAARNAAEPFDEEETLPSELAAESGGTEETAVPTDGPAAPVASAPTTLLVAAVPEPEAKAAPPIPDLAQ
jgi:hypothetical protein